MNPQNPPHRIFLICLLAALLVSACGGRPAPEDLTPSPTVRTTPLVFRLPTLTPTAIPETPLPTSPPNCLNNLTFLEDLSIPDGEQVSPGAVLDKRWKVENSGTCNWNHDYTLRLVAGDKLGAKKEQALYPARSGTVFAVEIQFTAPNEEGPYSSAWQAHDPEGQAFGDPIYIDIVVAR